MSEQVEVILHRTYIPLDLTPFLGQRLSRICQPRTDHLKKGISLIHMGAMPSKLWKVILDSTVICHFPSGAVEYESKLAFVCLAGPLEPIPWWAWCKAWGIGVLWLGSHVNSINHCDIIWHGNRSIRDYICVPGICCGIWWHITPYGCNGEIYAWIQ